jgi:hypothetical protein
MLIAATLGLVTAACSPSAGTPTTPTPPTTVTPPSPGPRDALSGTVVDEDERPVADATVKIWPFGIQVTPIVTTTDATGGYQASVRDIRPVEAVASKPGYEPADRYIGGSAAVVDFRLWHVRRLAAGASIHVVVDPRDGMCGLDWEWFCQTVRVTPPAGGALRVEAVGDDPAAPVCLSTDILFQPCPNPIVRVASGVDVPVYVFVDWTTAVARGFTLTASEAR